MTTEQDQLPVLATFTAMSEAWARQDAEEFAACYADEATVIGPGIYLRGRDDISRSMAAAFAGPLKDSLRPHSPQMVRVLADRTAIVVTESATLLPGEATAPPDRQHRVTWVLTDHDGRWLVEANHICQASPMIPASRAEEG